MYQKPTCKITLSLIANLVLALLILFSANAAVANDDGDVDLTIDMKAPQHVEPGGTYVINLSYSNEGVAVSPQDTWVKVTLADQASFISAADLDGLDLPPDVVDGNTLTWQVGSVPASSCCRHIKITLQAATDLPEETPLTSTGEIGSSAAESITDNNTASVASVICDMAGSTKQTQAGEVKPGDVVTYTLTLRLAKRSGQDSQYQRDVVLTDVLPPVTQARFLGWDSQIQGTYDGAQLRWQGQVRAGEPVTLQYRLGIEGDIPVGSLVTNRAHLGWSNGNMDIEPVTIETYLTDDDHMFGKQGGQWQHKYGVTLDVPPDAVSETTRFQFRALFENNPTPDTPPGWIYAHRAFELTAFQFGELHRFNQPLTITVGYDDKDVQGLDQNTLRLWYRTGPGEPWMMAGEPFQHQNGQISFTTDHFTEFALMGQGAYNVRLPLVSR